MTLEAIFRLFLFVREASQNHGLRVEAIQHWGGGQPGDSWCAWLVTLVLDLFFQGASPIPRMGSCEAIYQLAKDNKWITTTPVPEDLVIYVNPAGVAHHIGMYLGRVDPLHDIVIAGNTSDDGTSVNGDRCAVHPVANEHAVYVHYPRAA